jgi:hypothetical protein
MKRVTRAGLCLVFALACRSQPKPPAEDAQPAAPIASSPRIDAAIHRPTPHPVVEAERRARAARREGARIAVWAARRLLRCVALRPRVRRKEKSAFARAPDFMQSIEDVRVDAAILVVEGDAIIGETDKVSEANLAAQSAAARRIPTVLRMIG